MKKFKNNQIYIEKEELQNYFKHLNQEQLEKLKTYYEFAKNDTKNKKLKSGAPLFVHPLTVALTLHNIGSDPETIYAALLHHCSNSTIEKIKNTDSEVYSLVKRLKQTNIFKERANFYHYSKELNRTLLMAGLKDFRALIIKLANKVNSLETISYLDLNEQKRIAKEALEIYAPIAHKLGINEFKTKIEDISLRILYPKIYEKLKSNVNQRIKQREIILKEVIDIVKKNFPDFKIYGRIKHFYSILKKLEKGKKIDEIYDFIAIRILTDNPEQCYEISEKLKELFPEMKKRYKDYINHPKKNGYQSIHNTFYYKNQPFEVQIRTWQMHYFAEYGIAAHWRYKSINTDRLDKFFLWSKQMIEFLKKYKIHNTHFNVFSNKIFTFTPKGDPIELPKNATALDFAFRVHTDIGLRAISAKINGEKKPLNTQLNSGDIVEIIISNKIQVNERWLNIVKSKSVKATIRNNLGMPKKSRKENEEINIISLINYTGKFKIAGCCKDIKYLEPIILVKTKSGYSVHRETCDNVLPTYKIEKLSWKELPTKIIIHGKDEEGVLIKILEAIKNQVKLYSVDASSQKNRFLIIIKTNYIQKNKQREIIKNIMNASKNIENVNMHYINEDIYKIKKKK